LARYRAQDWDGAERRLAQLLAGAPDSRLYQMYAQRVAFFRTNPPGSDWDGVFRFETK
jgi:adenylate cyclase